MDQSVGDGAGYGEVFSFGVDDGELDGMSLQKCFVLGFELGDFLRTFCDMAEGRVPPEAELVAHPENKERIERAAKHYGVKVRVSFHSDDWLRVEVLSVGPRGEPGK